MPLKRPQPTLSSELFKEMMQFVEKRLVSTRPPLGAPKTEAELKTLMGETVTSKGIGGEKAFSLFKEHLLAATVPSDHSSFLSFVPAAPTPASSLFDIVTSASSIHGAYWMTGAGGIFGENEAMRWLVSLANFPESAFGVFTSGGTVANLSALVTARDAWRTKHPEQAKTRQILLVANSAHSSNKQMANVIDCDIIVADVDNEERLTSTTIQNTINTLSPEDQARVFCVIASAGTTNAGVIDDLESIGHWCNNRNIWMHIDAAYGGGAMASSKTRPFFKGTRLADSLTVDPHKWLFSPYDCGAVIYRDMSLAKAAHSQKAPYLDVVEDSSIYGFSPAEYQIQLSRRLRGLPLWFSLATNGTDSYSEMVDTAIDLAIYAENKITELPHIELVRPRGLSIVIFRRLGWNEKNYYDWSKKLHKEGTAFVVPTRWEEETVTRFCFISPYTTESDIDDILETMH